MEGRQKMREWVEVMSEACVGLPLASPARSMPSSRSHYETERATRDHPRSSAEKQPTQHTRCGHSQDVDALACTLLSLLNFRRPDKVHLLKALEEKLVQLKQCVIETAGSCSVEVGGEHDHVGEQGGCIIRGAGWRETRVSTETFSVASEPAARDCKKGVG